MTTTLRQLGECRAIAALVRKLRGADSVVVGPGDDCAVVRPAPNADHDWLLTSDPVIAGIHFECDADPRAIGHKAIGRVLSDIAAMGGTPQWALIDIAAPSDMPLETLEALYDGLCALADRHGLAIVGGDVAESPVLEVHAFGVGRVPAGRACLRSGAGAGDALYVTGALGGSRTGHHLTFEPRVAEGQWLRQWATAMLDVSDGLATDLRHLMDAGGLGARLRLDAIPLSPALRAFDGANAVQHALRDGEDFELLFTVAPDRAPALESAWRGRFPALACTRIGEMTAAAGALEAGGSDGATQPLTQRGYEHFED